MFSLQAGMPTLRVSESLQHKIGDCHYVIYEMTSLGFPLRIHHQIPGSHNSQ